MKSKKTLSVRQPWAWLIVNAELYPNPKQIENRSWSTKVRGEVLIHASKVFDKAGYESVIKMRPDLAVVLPQPSDYQFGGIVGKAEITDCVSRSDSPWFVGGFGFVLKNAFPIPFAPCKGKLGFFSYPDEPMHE